ncbi:MAG: DUF4450 domain-containing protein [Pyrinomonadaceae bacterium]
MRLLRGLLACLLVLLSASASDSAGGNFVGRTERPLRYQPEGTDFRIENGAEFFNRPLYGTHTAFRVDAGDRPEFSLYLPGRGGVLRLGLKTAAGAKWLFEAENVLALYRPGSMLYEIRDPLLGGGALHLTALPLGDAEGLVLRAELRDTSAPLELVWAYGGANGERGRRGGDIGTEEVPVSQFFQLKPEHCRDNSFSIEANTFKLRSKSATIAGLAPRGSKQAVADATKWNSLNDLLTSAGRPAEFPVVAVESRLLPGQPSYLGLQRVTQTESEGPPVFKVEDLPAVFEAAEQRRREVAEKILVETPDPFVNAAAAALAVAADGVWDEPQGAFMHGAVAWRSKLLGWRGPYAGDALGWHERARRHLSYWAGRQNTGPAPVPPFPQDSAVNFGRNEPMLHTNGDLSNSHYDMNLVYIDELFRHLMWTGDLEFAREMWPVIERHLAWERRLFRRPSGPDGLPLYEAYAAIWASDDLEYNGGGATHSSAYNYFHNRMAARLARLLGKDAAPYEREAELILKAMRRDLWLSDLGWFAEWRDLLGLRLAHPNAALWSFYHATDSEVPTPFEAWQMSRFVDTQIAHIPVRGAGVPAGTYYTLPTTSWMPYTWSTNNVVMAEALHTSLAYWQAGRGDEAFRLFKGAVLDSMYMGLCPGNVGMTTHFDMARGESQRDFADAVGVMSRALVEGLFGVRPDALGGEVLIRPGLPAGWERAELRHADFRLAFRRAGLTETYTFEPRFKQPMRLRLRAAALRDGVARVTVNGRAARWRVVEDSIGRPRVEIESPPASRQEIVITWEGAKPSEAVAPKVVARDVEFRAGFGAARLLKVADPQGALGRLRRGPDSFRATAAGTLGHRTVFAKVRQGSMTWWSPVAFEIRPPFEIIQAESQDTGHLRFSVRNNTHRPFGGEVSVRAGGRSTDARLASTSFGEACEVVLDATGLLPGSNKVYVELGGGRSVEGVVTNWKIAASRTASWEPLDLSASFNERLTRVFENEYLRPRSPYVSLAIPKQGVGSWVHWDEKFEVDDSGLRAAARHGGGRILLPQGVPFRTPGERDAKNIAFTSRWENYPVEVSVPLGGRASHLYLLMAGSTNWMQSRFDNGEVVLAYADGTFERLALHNPTNWWPIDQDYFIDDYAFRRPEPIPPRVDLQSGQVRLLEPSGFKGKGGRVKGGAATVLDLPLRADRELKSLTVRTLANEVLVGLMAATLAR